jgi:cytochrome c oxidase subunit 4
MADTAAAHAPGAVEHQGPSYLAVFIYLTLLTAAELGVYGMGLPKTVMVGALVALALAKATLVAMYFMHLAIERKGLWVVAATPLVIIAVCYLMLRPDLSRRSWASHPENVVIGHAEGAAATAEQPQQAAAPAEAPPAAAASAAAP